MKNWKKYLKPDERAELREIEAELTRAKKVSAALSQKRRQLQQLASRRMVYAESQVEPQKAAAKRKK